MGFSVNQWRENDYLARFRSIFGRFLEICGLLIGGYPGNDSRLYEGEFGVRFFHERCEVFVIVALEARSRTIARSKFARFCWCGSPLSVVRKASNSFSARVSSSPFFLPDQP